MPGWTGTVLRVNLTNGFDQKGRSRYGCSKEIPWLQRAGCLLLYEGRSKPGVDALGPDNNLIFANRACLLELWLQTQAVMRS